MSLKISENLSLPDEAVTQTFAILAKRGVGKTYTASVMVEEMLKNGLPVVVLDPIGVWWGLRSSADGKKPGLSILIAGGDHADIPITPNNGDIMANLIIDEKLSVVIDFSHFRKGEQVKFVTDFAETLYHRNRTALHVVVDEADAFAPQRAMPNEARMLGAMEDIVRRGRARGIGVTMITQRPAVLNKNVLTQIEVLIALRMTAPLDQKAIDDWVRTHAEEGQREEFMAALPSMPIGTAWFWSPGWLDIFKKVKIRTRETLDSSSTPKVGKLQVTAHSMADVNIAKIREQLAETIEKVESEDPKILRRRIAELERELAVVKRHPVVEIKKVPVVTDKVIEDLMRLFDNFGKQPLVKALTDLKVTLDELAKEPRIDKPTPVAVAQKDTQIQISDNKELRITGGAQRMLEVLAARYPLSFTKSELAALTYMSPKSGTFGTYFSLLRTNGFIEVNGQGISLAEKGRDYVGDTVSAPETTEEVLDMWRSKLTGGARRMFDVLVGQYPSSVERTQLGELTDMASKSGTFGTYLSMLKRNGLVESSGSELKATDALFVRSKV